MSFSLRQVFPQSISRTAAAAVLIATLIAVMAATLPALAQTETILYNFCSLTACADGDYPNDGPIMDAAGNLYGTSIYGGAYSDGAVYKLAPDGTETVLYSFGARKNDGKEPFAGLVMDSKGNLYGTTSDGGENGGGVVFRVTSAGVEKVLYNFCAVASCADGTNSYGRVILDKLGNIYGTTSAGGAHNLGVVFKLTPSGTETVLHSFSGGKTDGFYPYAGLVLDAAGNLYGTTTQGGYSEFCEGGGCGTVFRVTATGTETILYSFCAHQTSTCTDGTFPRSTLLRDSAGDFYGTTNNGGTSTLCGGGCGTAFKLSGKTETILHSFGTGSTDAQYPMGALVMDSAGNLYGATNQGGSSGQYGAVFEISSAGTETVLHSFTNNGVDGLYPQGSLWIDSSGNLYGVTSTGGTGATNGGGGALYEITP
jgi:uncharacterized repeat protein (TIGR03803 family)